MKEKNIGLDVSAPKSICNDRHCAFHGLTTVRGRQFEGEIKKVSDPKSVVVEWQRLFYVPKYQRYEKRRTKLKVHNPPCINAITGDKVLIAECRKISKTKNFVIIEKVKNESIKG